MIIKILFIICSIFFSVLISLSIMYFFLLPKFGVVKIPVLLEKSKQFSEVKSKIKIRSQLFELKKDSMLQLYVNSDPQKKDEIKELLSNENKANEEYENILTQGALNQINQKIATYSEKKGYFAVFGGNFEGSILYASSELDLTDDLIKYINNE